MYSIDEAVIMTGVMVEDNEVEADKVGSHMIKSKINNQNNLFVLKLLD